MPYGIQFRVDFRDFARGLGGWLLEESNCSFFDYLFLLGPDCGIVHFLRFNLFLTNGVNLVAEDELGFMGGFGLRPGGDSRLNFLEWLSMSFFDILFVDGGSVTVLSERGRKIIFEETIVLLFELFVNPVFYDFFMQGFDTRYVIDVCSISCNSVLVLVWVWKDFFLIQLRNRLKYLPTVEMLKWVFSLLAFQGKLSFTFLEKELCALMLRILCWKFFHLISFFCWFYCAESSSIFLIRLHWRLYFFRRTVCWLLLYFLLCTLHWLAICLIRLLILRLNFLFILVL